MPCLVPSVLELQASLVALHRDARLVLGEDSPRDEAQEVPEAILAAREIANRALRLLGEIEEAYTTGSRVSLIPPSAVDAWADISGARGRSSEAAHIPSGEDAVADTCFVAGLEVTEARAHLDAVRQEAPYALAQCERVHRKVRRIAAAIEGMLSRVGGRPPTLRDENETLEGSLSIRARYAALRRQLPDGDPPRGDALSGVLRRAANALAVVLGREDPWPIRLADRALLSSLHGRILAWAHRQDLEEGMRLHRDLAAAGDLLMGVSQRQELRAHDGAVLNVVHRLLLERSPVATDSVWSNAICAQLERLRGLDPELDELLADAGGGPTPTAVWSERLRETVRRLQGTEDAPERNGGPDRPSEQEAD